MSDKRENPDEIRAGFKEIVDKFRVDVENYLISKGLGPYEVILKIERENWRYGYISGENIGFLGDTTFSIPIPYEWENSLVKHVFYLSERFRFALYFFEILPEIKRVTKPNLLIMCIFF